MQTEESTSLKWNQHPVISTVLWMLGTDLSNPTNTATGDSEKKHNSHNNVVGWKDENGGSLSEYLNQIQAPVAVTRSETGSSDLPVPLERDTKTAEQSIQPSNPLAAAAHNHQSTAHEPGIDNENQTDINQSPLWGFYVPITPPQQEMYVKHEKITIQSIQADQRKR